MMVEYLDRMATAVMIAGIGVVIGGVVVWLQSRLRPPTPSTPPAPYRRVKYRNVVGNSEHVELECGHHLNIQHHRRATFPCEECKETGTELPGNTK